MTRRASLAALTLLAGCGTLQGTFGYFPQPFGGLRRHAEILGIIDLPPGEGSLGNLGASLDLAYARVFYGLAFPVTVVDLGVSTALDLALAPVSLTLWVCERRRASRRPEPPRTAPAATPVPPAITPVPPALELALDHAQRAAPGEDAARRTALRTSPHRGSGVQPFVWLPEGHGHTPVVAQRVDDLLDGTEDASPDRGALLRAAHVEERAGHTSRAVALCERILDDAPSCAPAWAVRGWARLQGGDVVRAEVDLRLAEALCSNADELDMDRLWCHMGLGRVAELRGDAVEARRRYLAAHDLCQVRVDPLLDLHARDLRERLAALAPEGVVWHAAEPPATLRSWHRPARTAQQRRLDLEEALAQAEELAPGEDASLRAAVAASESGGAPAWEDELSLAQRIEPWLRSDAERHAGQPTGVLCEALLAERRLALDEAEALCTRALALDPLRGDAWLLRGLVRRARDPLRAEVDLLLAEALVEHAVNLRQAQASLQALRRP